MPQIKIVTDSTADLGQELLTAYDIGMIPLLVQFDQESYEDGVDIDSLRLFQMVEEQKQLPKTASPGPAYFQEAFAEFAKDGSQVIYIGISSKLSAAQQNARIAASTFPEGQVYVVDSLNLSTGIGLQVLSACDMVREGKSAEEIVRTLEQDRSKVRTTFMIDTMEYLYKGGRCNSLQALMGSLLHIRPIIAVVDGAMIVDGKVRGSRQRAIEYQLDKFAQHVREGLVRPDRVFVTHTSPQEDVEYAKKRVREIFPEAKSVLDTRAGSVIGSHCGPGTLGILYVLK